MIASRHEALVKSKDKYKSQDLKEEARELLTKEME